MKITITSATINSLMKLYNEMEVVPNTKFNQNNCESCIIGHALNDGIIKQKHFDEDDKFNDAVMWVGLPLLKEDLLTGYIGDYSIYDELSNYEFGLLGNYLFGNDFEVRKAASILGLNSQVTSYTPKQAQKRITAVLNMA